MPGRHQQAPGTPLGSAVVTLCHFLHIWLAGIADRTVWEGPEPVIHARLQVNSIISATKSQMQVIPAGFASAGTRVIGFKFNQKGQ
jgi:hypothetical protein